MTWFVLLACGSGQETMRSTPMETTVDLRPPAEVAAPVVFSGLAELFPPTVGMPRSIATLTPGMQGEAARALLVEVHRPGIRVIAQRRGGFLVALSELAEAEGVGVALILADGGASLHEVDMSLPTAEAEAVLGELWGEPEATTFDDQGSPVYRWVGQPWTAQLQRVEKKSVLKYMATGS